MESAVGKILTFSSVSTTVGKTGKALPAGEGLAGEGLAEPRSLGRCMQVHEGGGGCAWKGKGSQFLLSLPWSC